MLFFCFFFNLFGDMLQHPEFGNSVSLLIARDFSRELLRQIKASIFFSFFLGGDIIYKINLSLHNFELTQC